MLRPFCKLFPATKINDIPCKSGVGRLVYCGFEQKFVFSPGRRLPVCLFILGFLCNLLEVFSFGVAGGSNCSYCLHSRRVVGEWV